MDVQTPEFYKLSITSAGDKGEPLVVHKNVFAYFLTLKNMSIDLESSTAPIPLLPFITRDMMKWIIDLYTIYAIEEEEYVLEELMHFYNHVEDYNKLFGLQSETQGKRLLTLFGEGKLPNASDLPLLLSVVEALNWLDAVVVLDIVLDHVQKLLRKLTSLEILALSPTNKRKADEDEGLLLTPAYKRETLIYDFLRNALPDELVRAKLNIPRVINPIACGDAHQLYLKADDLYGCGNNDSGQLGLNRKMSYTDVLVKTSLVKDKNDISLVKPVIVAASDFHSLCLGDNGVLYGCGSNRFHQIGETDNDEEIERWTEMPVNDEVLMITTSSYGTFVVTNKGLLAIGNDEDGQLGSDRKSTDEHILNRLTKIQVKGDVINIACGKDHTVLQTTQGLYATGKNVYGQCARHDEYKLMSFKSMIYVDLPTEEDGFAVQQIACGDFHTLVIRESVLYACGLGTSGQLGTGDNVSLDMLTQIIGIEGIPINVCAKNAYSILHTSTGLYATGGNTNGVLGVNDFNARYHFTRMIETYEGIIQSVTCGPKQVFLLTSEGVYITGKITKGEEPLPLGNGEAGVYTTFVKVNVDMGYYNLPRPLLISDEERQTKKPKLDCVYCHGKARFMSHRQDSLPVCSKHCLYKAKLQ